MARADTILVITDEYVLVGSARKRPKKQSTHFEHSFDTLLASEFGRYGLPGRIKGTAFGHRYGIGAFDRQWV